MPNSFIRYLSTPKEFWLSLAVVVLISLCFRLDGTTPDISWLTDMCMRMLNGEKAYVDIFETTPPIPTLLYMPGAFLSQITGVSAEIIIVFYTYVISLLVLWLTAKILPSELPEIGPSKWIIVLPAAIFLFIICDDAFGQREYYSALFTLPIFAVFVRHAYLGDWPNVTDRFWAALLCGLGVAIKPPLFALPIMLLAAWFILRHKRIRFVYSSGLIFAGSVSAILTIGSLLLFPEYLRDISPLMVDVYVPVREKFAAAFGAIAVAIILYLGISSILSLRKKMPPVTVVAMVLAIGYFVAYMVQNKYFAYHLVPAGLFALIAICAVCVRNLQAVAKDGDGLRKQGVFLFAVMLIPAIMMLAALEDKRPHMQDLNWATALDNPTALSLSPDLSIGFPLARQINAKWIDRIHSQWVVHYAHFAASKTGYSAEQLGVFKAYQQRELDRVVALIETQKPQIIIQCRHQNCEWLTEEFLAKQPKLFDDYFVLSEQGPFRIWQRQKQ